ncbi:MAG: hypothetical protein HOE69_02750 [Euryarchaeota archaeon]|nr:hypothetical protein [Euryarchaeota archaeon]
MIQMLAAEQILHAAMILSVESEEGLNEGLIVQVQETLECDTEDHNAAMEHIEQHRDNGDWGGRSDAVLHRSRERIREAMNEGTLPTDGELAEKLHILLGDEDDGEVDPFAELGISSSGGSGGIGSAPVASNDPLAAFMDGDDEEEEDMVDESGFLASGTSLLGDDDSEEEVEEELEEEVEEEPEEEVENIPETSTDAAYEMLMATCWIDGILDPAEAKLLARKRQELGISFEQHLVILRNMLERAS